MWLEGEIQGLAASQHGLVHRPQLVGTSVTDAEIQWRLREGRLKQVYPGVYYLDSMPATWRTEVLAGVLAAGEGAVASHRTAGVLWEFDAIFGRMVEVSVPFTAEPAPTGVILHRTRRPNPRVVLDGIPVSPPEKGLLDLASMLPESVLIKATRSGLHKGTVTVDSMDQAIAIYGGRGVTGTRKMRRVIRMLADDKSASAAEIDLKFLVLDAPVPTPVQQLQVRLPDGSNAYPDFAWPDRKRIVEADGFDAHGTPEQLQHDLWRQNQLMDLGWEIRRFTATDIRVKPRQVRDEITRFVNKPFRADL